MPNLDLDLTGTIHQFMADATSERKELMAHFNVELNHNRAVKMLLAEVGQQAANNGLPPLAAMGAAMAYGLALGILMERDRLRRRRLVS